MVLPGDGISHVVGLILAHHVCASGLLALRGKVTLGINIALPLHGLVFTVQTVDIHQILVVLDVRDFEVVCSERPIIVDAFHAAVHSRLQQVASAARSGAIVTLRGLREGIGNHLHTAGDLVVGRGTLRLLLAEEASRGKLICGGRGLLDSCAVAGATFRQLLYLSSRSSLCQGRLLTWVLHRSATVATGIGRLPLQ